MKYNFDLQLDDRNSLTLIAKQVERETVVLEFGPANGRLTHYLKEHKNCKVYAVEIDEEAAKDASKYTEDILVGDIEKLEWLTRWENIEFDYIIFADVLEHLRNPMEVLKQTKCLLKDEGKVLLSVPNVAHNSVLINLHRNIFSYTKVGLLDDTHIHLFSYYSLKEMCSFAGYTPVVEDAVYIGVGDTEIHNSYKDVSSGLEKELRNRKYGNVYQFYFVLQKTYQLSNFGGVTEYKIKQTAPGYFFQVYTDRGSEYCEENSVKISTTGKGDSKFQVNLDDLESIRAIRIDPLDCSCIVADMSIELDCGEKKHKWKYDKLEFNGFRFAERVVFDNDDPQVIINGIELSGEQSGVLTVSLRYVDVGISKELAEELRAIQQSKFGGVTEHKISQNASGHFFQVYTDRGCEYCEENSVKISTTAKGYNKFQVNLDNLGSIKAIRIDPLECSCIVADMSIELDCGEKKYKWKYDKLDLNGFRFAERVVFDNDDPQVVINNINHSKEQNGVLTVSLRYVDVDISKEIAEELRAIICDRKCKK